jgi:argonaute-like protein implicated in RNA metabolism and viral defense
MTIYEIKRRTQETAPYFFARATMKFFEQTLKDYKVYKVDNENYLITAPMRMRGKVIGHTRRLFNTKTNKLLLED